MIELRDYQQKLYDEAQHAFAEGHRRVLVQAPCGAGKSYLFAKMAENATGEVLVLMHRQELLEQTRALFEEHGIKARFAMILTEANQLGRHPKPRLIIADESHLARSKSWMKVLDYYDTFVAAFTATPVRLDSKPLGDVFDYMVIGPSVKFLIENKRLAPYEYYAPTAIETDGLQRKAGDFLVKDLDQLMSDRAIYSNVLKSWERLAKGQKSIAYCVSVRHAKETAARFTEAGYPAVAIDGNMPPKQRAKIMEDFRLGRVQILCNVGIISEGVSIDDVGCTLLLRPTESHALYWQQGMRAMRYMPGKVAIIIDAVGNYTRNPLFDADVEWSLTKSEAKRKPINDNGDFFIRTCGNCFKVFETAPVCPHCGHKYELHSREIKAREEIELKRITAEEAARAEQERKRARAEQGRAQSFEELIALAKSRGYSHPTAWAAKVMRGRRR